MNRLRTANLLGALAGAVASKLEGVVKGHANSTDSAAAAMQLIGVFEGCSKAQLSAALKLSHSATVRLIEKLESEDLVVCRPGTDKRTAALFLTRVGNSRALDVLKARCVALEEIVNSLSKTQMQQLDGIAETVLRNLTDTPLEAAHICRLCDENNCPPSDCPVHIRAGELVEAATR